MTIRVLSVFAVLLLGVVVQSTGPGTGLLGSNTDKDPRTTLPHPSTGLIPSPFAAGTPDEELAPDDNSGLFTDISVSVRRSPGTTCIDTGNCFTLTCEDDVDEVPTSPDANYLTDIDEPGGTIFDFPTPASNPSTAPNAQAIEITWSKCDLVCDKDAAGENPFFDLRLLCGLVFKDEFLSNETITVNEQNSTHTFTYSVDPDCLADGSTLRIGYVSDVVGSGSTKRWACLDAIEWEVTY